MNFDKLLKPKTVAVIGASEKSGFGGDTCKVIMEYTEDLDRIYFVNPKWDSVFGRKCYKGIREIPTTVDLAIICTPKSTIEFIIEEAATKGCGGAVVFASGYGETGLEGKKDEQALIELCEKYNIALLGPNCAGFANYIDNVFSFAFLMEKRERKGNIGLVSQSGQICLSGLDSPAMKFSYVISCGNSTGTKIEDYINFLVEDDNTKVVAAYVEGISDASKFVSVLKKAAEKRKPLIILKAGRSYKASELASSHTGSLSGSDKAIDALFEKFGVIRVEDIQELLATANMFSTLKKLPKTDKFACVTVSGGEASVMADVGYLSGVDYIDINQDTIDKLKKIMPNYAMPNNPLDMTATVASDSDKFAAGIKAMMEEETVGAVLVGWTILPEIYDTATIYLTEGIEKVAKESWAKPIIMVPFVEHTRNRIYVDKLANVGVPILPSLFYAFKILKYLIQFSKYDYNSVAKIIAIPKSKEKNKVKVLSEYNSKILLKDAGIKMEHQVVVKTKDELINSLKDFNYPLVLKIESPDILHKSDHGLVKLNINTQNEALDNFDIIMKNVKENCSNAKVNGILVETMKKNGVELILGFNNDDQFGPMVMIGFGGVLVEVLKDVKLYPAPMSKHEAMNMIKSLKGYKLLKGYRGTKPCDIEALADIIVKISDFAYNNCDTIKELDINPLFIYPEGEGVVVIDALIVKYLS